MARLPSKALLAGPILRRSDRDAIHVWVALSDRAELEAEVFEAETRKPLGRGAATTIQIGGPSTRLHVALVRITPLAGTFPVDQILGYTIKVGGASLLEIEGADLAPYRWGYGAYKFPTLVLREAGRVSILHASCRKPHGHGADAMVVPDRLLHENARFPLTRPGALYLTGDQIYADDVALSVIPRITLLAEAMGGVDELVVWPGATRRKVSTLGYGTRAEVLKGLFTSGEAANHLIGFGEFAAAYLLAWGDAAWAGWPLREESRGDVEQVTRYRLFVRPVRRALANVPTYMIFDDHDVTDDWNLTPGWEFRAHLHPLTRRVICNALAAYAIFQGWGNAPDAGWPKLIEQISKWVASPERRDAALEDELLGRYWGYTTPRHPEVLVLDTRSHRRTAGRAPEAAAVLIDDKRVETIARHLRQAPSPIVIVSPVPLVGVGLIDMIQRAVTSQIGKETFDYESWAASSFGFYMFRLLIHKLAGGARQRDLFKPTLDEKPVVVVLSGDVHYSSVTTDVVLDATAGGGAAQTSSRVLQFTASAVKNAWAEGWKTSGIRTAVAAGQQGGRAYFVYVSPDKRVIEAALRALVERAKVGGRGVAEVPLAFEELREILEHGAPLAIDVRDRQPGIPSHLHTLGLLDADDGDKAITFDSAVGWLVVSDTEVQMKIVEWVGVETIDGQVFPKLKHRNVTIR